MDEEESEREFRLIIQTLDEAHSWRARLERAGKVREFESPLELLEWLEAKLKRPLEGLR